MFYHQHLLRLKSVYYLYLISSEISGFVSSDRMIIFYLNMWTSLHSRLSVPLDLVSVKKSQVIIAMDKQSVLTVSLIDFPLIFSTSLPSFLFIFMFFPMFNLCRPHFKSHV